MNGHLLVEWHQHGNRDRSFSSKKNLQKSAMLFLCLPILCGDVCIFKTIFPRNQKKHFLGLNEFQVKRAGLDKVGFIIEAREFVSVHWFCTYSHQTKFASRFPTYVTTHPNNKAQSRHKNDCCFQFVAQPERFSTKFKALHVVRELVHFQQG